MATVTTTTTQINNSDKKIIVNAYKYLNSSKYDLPLFEFVIQIMIFMETIHSDFSNGRNLSVSFEEVYTLCYHLGIHHKEFAPILLGYISMLDKYSNEKIQHVIRSVFSKTIKEQITAGIQPENYTYKSDSKSNIKLEYTKRIFDEMCNFIVKETNYKHSVDSLVIMYKIVYDFWLNFKSEAKNMYFEKRNEINKKQNQDILSSFDDFMMILRN